MESDSSHTRKLQLQLPFCYSLLSHNHAKHPKPHSTHPDHHMSDLLVGCDATQGRGSRPSIFSLNF
jgi:hypothetical protein